MRSVLTILICLIPLFIFGAYLQNVPTEVTQPDGSVLNLLASGDEYANRLHDADGYSIIQSPVDGYYYYAVLEDKEPAPSGLRADSGDPRSLGIEPGITISPAKYKARVEAMTNHPRKGSKGPNTGVVNNIAVYIRFSDQTEFPDPRSFYDAKFNPVGDDAYSLRNYFHQVSYDQLDYVTHHYPVSAPEINVSYQDSHPRDYYVPYNAITNPNGYQDFERTDREHLLLANALNAISAQIPPELNIDGDNDGYVDNVCFIIRGPHTAWAELLWAHRWALYTQDVFINGKQVWDFTFQPEDHNSVRTLCHEMFHSVDAPDLYHYTFNGITPAGCWDIMESGNGHMGMYMKSKYGGWIGDIPTISYGTYTLNPVTSQTNNAYRINLSNGNILVLEYRKRGADIFEADIPGSGLLIYRINPNMDGNSQGPPDEVYVYRPNGTNTANGLIADASFSAQNYRTEFNVNTNPACFLQTGENFPINIRDIGIAGDTINFTYSPTNAGFPPVISSLSPADGSVLPIGNLSFTANVSAPGSSIISVDFYLDGNLVQTMNAAPFTLQIPANELSAGQHRLVVTALSANGLTSSKKADLRIVDPSQLTWFGWISDDPRWQEYGRGAVPIKAAIDMNLGTQPYLVKKIAFDLVPDPYGFPENPGLVTATIRRFSGGAIQNEVLLNIGDIICPMNGRFEYTVNAQTPISGEIAVELDLREYQNIRFDTNAASGHSWLTEPNRIWTDALGRGIQGAAAIELQLQAPGVGTDDPAIPLISELTNYPNPFNPETTISFSLEERGDVSLDIYNLKGQLVRHLFGTELDPGVHNLVWNGIDDSGKPVATGMYFCRIISGRMSQTRKMLLLK